ncbi:MAG: hypothetical protein ACOY33_06385 [Pseudomonadota bacterium]
MPDSHLIETYNSLLAGRPVSPAMATTLQQDWVPALASLLRREGHDSARWQQARRLLAMLGWLLRRLPHGRPGESAFLLQGVRDFRDRLHPFSPVLFGSPARCTEALTRLDDALLTMLAFMLEPGAPRPHLVPLPPFSAPDRAAPVSWQRVMDDSLLRKREENGAVDAMRRVAALRAGDRLRMRAGGGRTEIWRVLRCEEARSNVLLVSEETDKQGVMGMTLLAQRVASGSIAILA